MMVEGENLPIDVRELWWLVSLYLYISLLYIGNVGELSHP
jgi:hypothetical protein